MSNITNIRLPTGKWRIFGNEEEGELDITSVDNQGQLTGTAFGTKITGLYNTSSGEIHFERQIKSGLLDWQTFTGYISLAKKGHNQGAGDYLLAGSYCNVPFGLGRFFGWYATTTIL